MYSSLSPTLASLPSYVYLIGIGGAGMSALARYFALKGCKVWGYDRTENLYTESLRSEGIEITHNDQVEAILRTDMTPDRSLIIYTPAIPDTHPQLNYLRAHNYSVLKRAEVLGMISNSYKAICVAGSHGKTTTTNMIAHLLHQAQEVDCTAFVGGLSVNYNSNFIYSDHSQLLVVEADEYDRSFLHLSPYMAVITSMDADHLDIYGDIEGYKEGFSSFCHLIQPGGKLLIRTGLDFDPQLNGVQVMHYGTAGDAGCDFYYDNVRVEQGTILFDWHSQLHQIDLQDISLGVPVRTNLENATAAIAIAVMNGVRLEDILRGIASFRGTKRRFEEILHTPQHILIDDYAHHPIELDSAIRSIQEIYGAEDVLAIFQPHLYSRTRDFYHEFAESLSLVNNVIVLDIYPAREEPIPGVSSALIYDHLTIPNKRISSKENLLSLLQEINLPQVILTIGAGDIDQLVLPIRNYLQSL